ncbi:cupin domain-containing protein [Streptomyces sp. NBC_01775]|uniref:cupin domain-containing protein n=1 Tax=Streptomyces sp. NBC_01775 TaxID=2975939 RepID=UPI002DD91F7B|nr:cupin domain-containing protein [Streptomyces sp. NBC_01775]WSB74942.1 cupin domain-containing protein [Streptomyces sp. NBC_01775]
MLTVIRGGSGQPSGLAEGTFTGEAWRDMLMSPVDGVAVGNVFFAPCSRTYWHSHVGGQLLMVLAGEGFVADENEAVIVRVGDMIWTPPGVRHWHGASSDRYMIHTAVTVGDTNWEGAVSDSEYAGSTG